MRPPCPFAVPFAVALLGAVASSPGAAAAQNHLTNGDFAAGLSGLTVAATPGDLVSSPNECSLAGAFGSGPACAVFGVRSEALDLVGVAVRGRKKPVEKLTKGLPLHP